MSKHEKMQKGTKTTYPIPDWREKIRVCIGCESPEGQPHEEWCPVVTGTLSSLDRRG